MAIKLNLDEQYIINQYKTKSALMIAKDLGVSLYPIYRILKEHNSTRKQNETHLIVMKKYGEWDNREYLNNLYNNKQMSVGDISTLLKIRKDIIFRRLRTYKIEKRSSQQAMLTPSQRNKMSEIVKNNWKNDDFRNTHINTTLATFKKYKDKAHKNLVIKMNTDEYKDKMRNEMKKRMQNPEYVKKVKPLISNGIKRCWATNENFRNKILKSLENARLSISPEEKSKMSKLAWEKLKKTYSKEELHDIFSRNSKKGWGKPGHKEKMKKIFSNPEFKIKSSKCAKELWQNPEYREKFKKLWSNQDFKTKMAQSRLNMPKTSSQQKILYSILDDLKIKYHKDSDRGCIIGFWAFDCRIDPQDGIKLQSPLLIEVQGDYWHNLSRTIKNDKSKATYIKEYFPHYDLKYLWEHEFHNKDRITSLIKYWLGIAEIDLIDFSFRDISHKPIDYKEAEFFISKYHYAGRVGRSGMNLGFYLKNKLIATIVYSQPVRQETATKQGYKFKEVLELSRLAIHPSYQKKNLASFIISKSIKTIKELRPEIKLLVSFADSTHNHLGTIYKASNWTLDGIVKPSYWYSDQDGYVCHKKTLWDHAKHMKMTESQYCQKYGYKKIKGKEKFRFIYKLS